MSTLSLWARRDPFAEFDALVRNAFGPVATWPARRATGFTPAAEISRDGEDAVVCVELPGVDVTNDVTVEVDRGRLVIRGERRDERTEERDGRSLREVRYGTFQRSFDLPAHVNADAISASYDAGVLSIRVSGAYTGTGARRIEISGGTSPTAVEGGTPAEASEDTAS
ncbi:Hsp20/alpha crystallin family protein [Rugosimonospora africana]|uniref:Heat shock protein Hsp20 n=1 Tax=Rugosimonospora africana TaxID=556532 RepID=A0A8J3VQM9_9ACTN|nr:Hsp20/alpha crystallin family protein [Rugosimonospora africana]GIH14503.1 heat shock protein Hsp20 [Rugosimonospora africana]